MKILAVANQKGGVGKSTVAVHNGYAAHEAGLRVLLVDFDRQGSLSTSFPPTGKHEGEASISTHLFAEGGEIRPEILGDRLAILRGGESLAMLDSASEEGIRRPSRHLRALAADYDVCIIDTPGVLGLNPPMTIAALVAADAVVCPFGVGLYEGAALADLWKYLQGIKANGYNPRLRLMGLLPSKVHTTSKEEMETLAALREQFGANILPMILGERASVKQSIAKRKPVWRGTRGAGHMVAAQEWRVATNYILTNLGVL